MKMINGDVFKTTVEEDLKEIASDECILIKGRKK